MPSNTALSTRNNAEGSKPTEATATATTTTTADVGRANKTRERKGKKGRPRPHRLFPVLFHHPHPRPKLDGGAGLGWVPACDFLLLFDGGRGGSAEQGQDRLDEHVVLPFANVQQPVRHAPSGRPSPAAVAVSTTLCTKLMARELSEVCALAPRTRRASSASAHMVARCRVPSAVRYTFGA